MVEPETEVEQVNPKPLNHPNLPAYALRLLLIHARKSKPLTPTHACMQGTFSTHAWLLRGEDGGLVLQYSGPSATLTVLADGGVAVTVPPPVLPPE